MARLQCEMSAYDPKGTSHGCLGNRHFLALVFVLQIRIGHRGRTIYEHSESNFHAHVRSPARPLGQVRRPHHGAVRRALLNVIANGFYAATRRRAEISGGDYEPTLTASTKSLGDRVEIGIRDNGTGMTLDVKEKMFNPFFTTKPTGEGTGLGLSISHDIIVKQHGGSIEVDTEPGEFTEIKVILPRVAVFV